MVKVNSEFMLSCDVCNDTWFPKEKGIQDLSLSADGVRTINLGNCRCGKAWTMKFMLLEGRMGSIPTQATEGEVKAYNALKRLKDTLL